MRVLYDHQLFSLQDVGGGSRYYYELVRYLAGLPHVQIELLLGMNHSLYPFRTLASKGATIMMFGCSPPPGVLRYLLNEAIGNAVAPFRGVADVYHPTMYRRMPLVRARRIVATHHDCTQERFPNEFRFARDVIRAKRSLYARADAIICVSGSCREDLLEFYDVRADKTRVIHHGMSPIARCSQAAEKLRSRVRREYLLFVGSRAPYKNFDALLKAFHYTGLDDSLDLLVLGGGPLTAEERGLMADLSLTDCVMSMPSVSDEFLGESYAAAKLFVYPSLWEGFGFPPLEAMAAGCPVLASKASSIPEVCRDAPFYFDPACQDSFHDALLRAVSDEEGRLRAIERGRQVAASYSWEECARETLATYYQCQ